jgi:hypothetical protein
LPDATVRALDEDLIKVSVWWTDERTQKKLKHIDHFDERMSGMFESCPTVMGRWRANFWDIS